MLPSSNRQCSTRRGKKITFFSSLISIGMHVWIHCGWLGLVYVLRSGVTQWISARAGSGIYTRGKFYWNLYTKHWFLLHLALQEADFWNFTHKDACSHLGSRGSSILFVKYEPLLSSKEDINKLYILHIWYI